ncbi:hypothetical protein [Deinococcus apachensis]|uniref:hypothetical protein n=1 Tax=Deinococcus apachensis TaxID=309886 RepID=UPI000369D710|nr:hypothetical protein [Deinococcus apachensis]
MEPVQITHLNAKRRRLWPTPDFGAFFMFFGISGTDWNREERLQQRFEREYYRQIVTLRLSGKVRPGRYALHGLPGEAKQRGWTVTADGRATSTLSDEGLGELRAWLARGEREVLPGPLG